MYNATRTRKFWITKNRDFEYIYDLNSNFCFQKRKGGIFCLSLPKVCFFPSFFLKCVMCFNHIFCWRGPFAPCTPGDEELTSLTHHREEIPHLTPDHSRSNPLRFPWFSFSLFSTCWSFLFLLFWNFDVGLLIFWGYLPIFLIQ